MPDMDKFSCLKQPRSKLSSKTLPFTRIQMYRPHSSYDLPHVGKLTLKNAFNSIKLAKMRNTAYISKHTRPTRLSS